MFRISPFLFHEVSAISSRLLLRRFGRHDRKFWLFFAWNLRIPLFLCFYLLSVIKFLFEAPSHSIPLKNYTSSDDLSLNLYQLFYHFLALLRIRFFLVWILSWRDHLVLHVKNWHRLKFLKAHRVFPFLKANHYANRHKNRCYCYDSSSVSFDSWTKSLC